MLRILFLLFLVILILFFYRVSRLFKSFEDKLKKPGQNSSVNSQKSRIKTKNKIEEANFEELK